MQKCEKNRPAVAEIACRIDLLSAVFLSKRFFGSNAWGHDFPVRELQSVHERIDALCIVSVFFRWQVFFISLRDAF